MDAVLRALKYAHGPRARYLLDGALRIDPQMIMPQLVKLYLEAENAERKQLFNSALVSIKNGLPLARRAPILRTVTAELTRDLPECGELIQRMLAP
jgi:hypothetical protein